MKNRDPVIKAHVWVRCDHLVSARKSIIWTLSGELGTNPHFFEWDFLAPMELWYTNKNGQGTYTDTPMVKITAYA